MNARSSKTTGLRPDSESPGNRDNSEETRQRIKDLGRRHIRVLIADDQPAMRLGIRRLLEDERDIEVVGEAPIGPAMVAAAKSRHPDIIVGDLFASRETGDPILIALRAETPDVHILIFSANSDDGTVFRAFQHGVQGYLLKISPVEEIIGAIRVIARGEKYIPPTIATKLVEYLSAPTLTRREEQVLQAVAAGKSNRGIAEELNITESTVKAHINSLLHKLQATDRAQAVITAVRRGLVQLD